MKSGLFVGIDVAVSKSKRLPIAAFQQGKTLPLPLKDWSNKPPKGIGNAGCLDDDCVKTWVEGAVRYLNQLQESFGPIRRVTIDAPRDDRGNRCSEKQVRTRLQCSIFASPSRNTCDEIRSSAREHLAKGKPLSEIPNANRIWMLAGFALWRALGVLFDCWEVYPHATVLALARTHRAKGVRNKATKEGLDDQLILLAKGLESQVTKAHIEKAAYGSHHDKLDAVLSAYVAGLDENEVTPLGCEPGDTIMVPRLPQLVP